MRKVSLIIENYMNNIIDYSKAVSMLKVYLNNKNINKQTFDNYIDQLEGLELTKEINSGF